MNPSDKQAINAKLTTISAQLQGAKGLMSALPPILPPSPAPGAPISTTALVQPLSNVLKMQTKATEDLIKVVKELIDKS